MQVVELFDDTRNIANPVAVAVHERARVYLVDHRFLPPNPAVAGRRHFRSFFLIEQVDHGVDHLIRALN
ncbi:hypothetical protein SDC9_77326 [bioreactor metagenome]|uniref:Uncharacterized protein n=1 Tax=bioreactor metagenome TaxID=1076179 RepID=A0A644YQJ8_9ZZZZ